MRHLRWLVPLLAVPVLLVVPPELTRALDRVAADADPGTAVLLLLALLQLVLLLLGLAGPVMALWLAVRGGRKVFRAWRRRGGHLTKAELATREDDERRRAAWEHARALRRTLEDRRVPPAVTVWDVVPWDGEVFFLDTTAHYSRYYGQDVSYGQSSGLFLGHPAFVLAGLGLTALGNARRRSAAEVQARARWREHQECRLLVSNQRLVCLAGGRWLSFPYRGMTAVYPEAERWSLVCQFPDVEPLALNGLAVPAAAVLTTLLAHGPDALSEHPSLRVLR